jgi:SAM-dependent methyltransferase
MLNIDFRKRFWDQKILNWEKEKYMNKSFLLDVNSSVKSRMILTKNILSQISKNKTLLEIGCGSTLLLDDLKDMGIKKYIGIDISSKAIEKAKKKSREINNVEFEFVNSDINEIDNYKVDICFSLGFLDWLSLNEIKQMNSKIDSKFFVHSFSEKRLAFSQLLHRFFVYMKYGHKTDGYQPQYYKSEEILDCFTNYQTNLNFFRHKKLSFGTLLYNLPIKITNNILNDQ